MTKCNHISGLFPLGEAQEPWRKSDLLFPECLKHHPATLARAEARSDPA